MRMTPPRCTSRGLAVLALLLLAGSPGAWAQSRSSNAQKLQWPTTFSGPPDFAFTREEAVSDATARAAREGEALPQVPTLSQMLGDDARLDPMGIYKPVVISATADVSGSADASATQVQPTGSSLIEKLLAGSVGLPEVKDSFSPDMAEFRAGLAATLKRAVEEWQPSAARYSFGGLMNKLVLQAIVTSPEKYAVINQQQYAEGDTMQLSVPVPVPDMEVINALQEQMPAEDSVTPALYKQYQDVYEQTIADYAKARQANPAVGRKILQVPVVIRSITQRKVVLEVNGERHELAIRFTY